MKNNKHFLILAFVVLVIGLAVGFAVGFPTGYSASGDTGPGTSTYESTAVILFKATDLEDDDIFISTEGLGIPASTWDTISNLLQSDSIREEIAEVYPNAEYDVILQPFEGSNMCKITLTSTKGDNLCHICELTVSGLAKAVNTALGFTCKIVQSPDLSNKSQPISSNV